MNLEELMQELQSIVNEYLEQILDLEAQKFTLTEELREAKARLTEVAAERDAARESRRRLVWAISARVDEFMRLGALTREIAAERDALRARLAAMEDDGR